MSCYHRRRGNLRGLQHPSQLSQRRQTPHRLVPSHSISVSVDSCSLPEAMRCNVRPRLTRFCGGCLYRTAIVIRSNHSRTLSSLTGLLTLRQRLLSSDRALLPALSPLSVRRLVDGSLCDVPSRRSPRGCTCFHPSACSAAPFSCSSSPAQRPSQRSVSSLPPILEKTTLTEHHHR